MINRVREYIIKKQMINKGDTIILGISGGADSVCLLFVLLELQVEYELQIIGVHVNHNLRGEESRRDQAYVEHICKENHIKCMVVDIDVSAEAKKRKRSLEEAGREVRQEAFEQVMEMVELGSRVKIATAHHSNDNAETMLMNLSRGTGITGLTGIEPVRENRIRPLLCVSRKEIESYLCELGVEYCMDSTNEKNIYTRNIVRNQVIPILEEGVNAQAVMHMNQAMEELGKIEEFLESAVKVAWDICVLPCGNQKELLICKAKFEQEPTIIKERIVKKAIEQMAGAARDITRSHVVQLVNLQDKQVGRSIHLPYQLTAVRVYQGIEIRRQGRGDSCNKMQLAGMELVVPGNTKLSDGSEIQTRIFDVNEMCQIQEKPFTKYFEYDIMTEVPYVRMRNAGDYIIINENGNKQMLKKYYITNKIPEEKRDSIPIIAIGSEVLWVIGNRRSSGYVVKKNTKKVLEIQYDGGNHGRDN